MVGPPRFAKRLIALVTPGPLREPVLGDLEEEFADLADQSGPEAARRWYWRQTRKALPGLLVCRLQSSRLLAALMALVIAYLVLQLVLSGVTVLFRMAYQFNLFQGLIPLALTVRLGLELLAVIAGGLTLGFICGQGGDRAGRLLPVLILVLLAVVLGPSLPALLDDNPPLVTGYLIIRSTAMALTLWVTCSVGQGLAVRPAG